MRDQNKKIYVIAGEQSGDFIGSKIIAHLRLMDFTIDIKGVGGSKMMSCGLDESLFPMEDISVFGLFEIIPDIFRINSLIQKTIEHICKVKPQILITIDSPGFCFRVAEKIKQLLPNIYLIHIVAPSVWAYKPERAKKVANIYNELLTLLPFEAPFFEKYGLKTSYIGHPIFEQYNEYDENYGQALDELIMDGKISTNVVTITPGSRESEIKRLLPIFIQAIIKAQIPDTTCIILASSQKNQELIEQIMHLFNVQYLITQDKKLAFDAANFVIAKSGTNNLEIAAHKKPMLICYKLNWLTWWWLKKSLQVKYACLINIIADKEIIPEFIQNQCNPDSIAKKLKQLFIHSELCFEQTENSYRIIQTMGLGEKIEPSSRAAQIIYNNL